MIEPATEAELAEAVRDAAGPLRVRGGGTRAPVPEGATVLSTARLSGIALYEPSALTLVAAAGTPMAEIEAALAEHRQILTFEPMDHRALMGTEGAPTLGGAVATAASGPRRVRAGGCRDSLIGARFVDGEGRVVRSGGRVMKNVTGYDLARLMAGARGTLGVLTEVAFKVLPAPATQATLTLDGLDVAASVGRHVRRARPRPSRSRVPRATRPATRTCGSRGWPTRSPTAPGGSPTTLPPSARQPSRPTPRPARRCGARSATSRPSRAPRARLADRGAPVHAPEAVEALGAERVMLDLGGGLIWARCPKGWTRARASQCRAAPGRCAALAAGRPGRPSLGPVAALSERLRERFDPRGILDAGAMA